MRHRRYTPRRLLFGAVLVAMSLTVVPAGPAQAGGVIRTETELFADSGPITFHGETQFFYAFVELAPVGPLNPPAITQPSGVVTLEQGGVVLQESRLQSGYYAPFEFPSLDAGSYTVVARYHGDLVYKPSESAPLHFDVEQAYVEPSLSLSPALPTYGDPLALRAQMTRSGNGRIPTGAVSFTADGVQLGKVALDDTGVATLVTRDVTAGRHIVKANYQGDSNYASASNLGITHETLRAAPELLAQVSPDPATSGETVRVTAQLKGPGLRRPTGSVELRHGDALLGTPALDGSGTATFSTGPFGVGVYTLTATYGGDGNHLPTSLVLPHEVVARAWVGGPDPRFSVPTNWHPVGIPKDGDTLLFPESGGGRLVDDLPSLTVASLVHAGANYEIVPEGGAKLTVNGGIVSEGTGPGSLEIEVPVVLPAVPEDHVLDVGPQKTLALTGVVEGSGGFIKGGPGELQLSGPNTFGGPVELRSGSTLLLNDRALGTASGKTLMKEGARVLFGPDGPTLAEPWRFAGGELGALNSDATLTGTIDVEGSVGVRGNLTFAGRVSGPGGFVLREGNSAFSNWNSFTGGVRVESGTVLASDRSSPLGGGPLTLAESTALLVTSGADVSNAISAAHGSAVFALEGLSTVSGQIRASGVLYVGTLDDASLSLGPVSGPGSLIVDGNVSTGSNTFTGRTTVLWGRVILLGQGNAVPGDLGVVSPDGPEVAGARIELAADNQIADGAAVTIEGGGNPATSLRFNGHDDLFDTLIVAGHTSLGMTSTDSFNTSTVTLNALHLLSSGVLELTFTRRWESSTPLLDVLVVTGAVTIDQPTLRISNVPLLPDRGSVLRIIENRGTGAISGTFAGLPEDSSFWVADSYGNWGLFTASYEGGDGNDFTLTRTA